MASTQKATLNKAGLLYNAGTFNGPINPDTETPAEAERRYPRGVERGVMRGVAS